MPISLSAGALREAVALKEEGLITAEDFERLKADILSRVAARAGAGAGAIQRTDVVSERLFQARGPFAHVVKVMLPCLGATVVGSV